MYKNNNPGKQILKDSGDLKIIFEKISNKVIKYSDKASPLFAGPYGRFDWLFSFHDFFVDPEALDAFANEFWNRYKKLAPLQVGGLEISGIPLVVAIVLKAKELGLECSGFFIRKERKTRAQARIIDGDLNENPIIIVDDVFKSGLTMERARVALKSLDKELYLVCSMIDFNRDTGKEWSREMNIPVHTFFDVSDFCEKITLDFENDAWDRRGSSKIEYQPLWHFASPDALPTNVSPKSSPVLIDNTLYFGSDSGIFRALDAANGSLIWQYDAQVAHEKGILSNPVYSMGQIFFGTYGGNVYCLDAKTGEKKWVCAACDWIDSSPLLVSTIGSLFIGTGYSRSNWKGGIAALELSSGKKIWEYQLKEHQQGIPAYWKEGNIVVVGTGDSTIIALHASSGSVAWEIEVDGPIQCAPLISAERKIVVTASDDGKIRINSLLDGQILFELSTQDACIATPLIYDKYLYCGSGDRSLYIIDLDKNVLVKSIDTMGRIYATPTTIDGNVIFGNSAGILEEINALSFKTESAIVFPDSITNKVIVSKDQSVIYVTTYLNEIYALNRKRC